VIIRMGCGCQYFADRPDAESHDSPQVYWCPPHSARAMAALRRGLLPDEVDLKEDPGTEIVKVAGDVL
jgi:hypothetical protein